MLISMVKMMMMVMMAMTKEEMMIMMKGKIMVTLSPFNKMRCIVLNEFLYKQGYLQRKHPAFC